MEKKTQDREEWESVWEGIASTFCTTKQNERNSQCGTGLTLLYINPIGSVSHATWRRAGNSEFKAQLHTNLCLPTYLWAQGLRGKAELLTDSVRYTCAVWHTTSPGQLWLGYIVCTILMGREELHMSTGCKNLGPEGGSVVSRSLS